MTRIIIIITAVIAAAALIYTGSVLLGSNTEPTPPLPTQEQVDALIDWEIVREHSDGKTFSVQTCSECGENAMLRNARGVGGEVAFVDYKCFACGFKFDEYHGSIGLGPWLDRSKYNDGTYALEATINIDTMRAWLAPHLVAENPVVRHMVASGEKAPMHTDSGGPLGSDPELAGDPIIHF